MLLSETADADSENNHLCICIILLQYGEGERWALPIFSVSLKTNCLKSTAAPFLCADHEKKKEKSIINQQLPDYFLSLWTRFFTALCFFCMLIKLCYGVFYFYYWHSSCKLLINWTIMATRYRLVALMRKQGAPNLSNRVAKILRVFFCSCITYLCSDCSQPFGLWHKKWITCGAYDGWSAMPG